MDGRNGSCLSRSPSSPIPVPSVDGMEWEKMSRERDDKRFQGLSISYIRNSNKYNIIFATFGFLSLHILPFITPSIPSVSVSQRPAPGRTDGSEGVRKGMWREGKETRKPSERITVNMMLSTLTRFPCRHVRSDYPCGWSYLWLPRTFLPMTVNDC